MGNENEFQRTSREITLGRKHQSHEEIILG
jgi:hypothetical protein